MHSSSACSHSLHCQPPALRALWMEEHHCSPLSQPSSESHMHSPKSCFPHSLRHLEHTSMTRSGSNPQVFQNHSMRAYWSCLGRLYTGKSAGFILTPHPGPAGMVSVGAFPRAHLVGSEPPGLPPYLLLLLLLPALLSAHNLYLVKVQIVCVSPSAPETFPEP